MRVNCKSENESLRRWGKLEAERETGHPSGWAFARSFPTKPTASQATSTVTASNIRAARTDIELKYI